MMNIYKPKGGRRLFVIDERGDQFIIFPCLGNEDCLYAHSKDVLWYNLDSGEFEPFKIDRGMYLFKREHCFPFPSELEKPEKSKFKKLCSVLRNLGLVRK